MKYAYLILIISKFYDDMPVGVSKEYLMLNMQIVSSLGPIPSETCDKVAENINKTTQDLMAMCKEIE